ncbi:MAG TPA: hypothetical protein VLV54_00970 [Thermoanaerobaculia bacterium]|nr:hypothetical protein [Thermoanaerobaculia bacterium]
MRRVSCVLGLAFVAFGSAGLAAPAKGTPAAARSREALERAVAQQPGDPSESFALGQSYATAGLRTPAVLAYLRYLSLDSESARAVAAAQAVRAILTQGVSAGKDGGIQVTISEPSEENPLSMIDLALSLTAATRHLDKSKGKTEIQLIAESLDTVFSIAEERGLRGQEGCFPCRQYLPFFLDLKDKSLLEPFLYVATSSLHLPGSSDWLAANAVKVNDLKKWLASKPAS